MNFTSEAIEQAVHLLHYASETGKKIDTDIGDSILTAEARRHAGTPPIPTQTREFLQAYARLAALMAPVSAATLRACDRRLDRAPWWSRLFRVGLLSEAQVMSIRFGTFALVVLCFIGALEGTRTFMALIAERQERLQKANEELRAVTRGQKTVDQQQTAARGAARSRATEMLEENLQRQKDELLDRQTVLRGKIDDLTKKVQVGYETLHRIIPILDKDDLRNLLGPIGTMLGGFLLPILYGALGTSAFVLRAMLAQMVNRAFDPAQVGEFVVRIFLGMLSGVTLQWMFVAEGKQIPGGVTPALLAFLGGYSVELLFTAIDRLISGIKEMIRPSVPPAAGPPTTSPPQPAAAQPVVPPVPPAPPPEQPPPAPPAAGGPPGPAAPGGP